MKWAAVKRRLIAGLVVIAPVTITAAVLWWIFQWLDGLLGKFIYPAIGTEIPGLGLLFLLLVLLAVGWLAERTVGARVVAGWHALLERFPLTRRLYTASHRIVRTVFGQDQRFFREVALVEYPSPERWSVGFIVAGAPAVAGDRAEDGVTVFIPTAPNPTTGFLVVVPNSQVVVVPWTLEEAFTFILSIGSVTPDVATESQPSVRGGDE